MSDQNIEPSHNNGRTPPEILKISELLLEYGTDIPYEGNRNTELLAHYIALSYPDKVHDTIVGKEWNGDMPAYPDSPFRNTWTIAMTNELAPMEATFEQVKAGSNAVGFLVLDTEPEVAAGTSGYIDSRSSVFVIRANGDIAIQERNEGVDQTDTLVEHLDILGNLGGLTEDLVRPGGTTITIEQSLTDDQKLELLRLIEQCMALPENNRPLTT